MPSKKVYWRGWSESELAAYQQDQGSSNHCAKYAAASGLNLLFGIVLTGDDLVDWVDSRPFKGTGKYTIWGNNNGSLVYQSAHLVRELGRQAGLPIQVTSQISRTPALLKILQQQNALCLLTLSYLKGEEPVISLGENTSNSLAVNGWVGGHMMILAAYDRSHLNKDGISTPWGFLSSWGSLEKLYWMTDEDFQRTWGRLSILNTVHVERTDISG
jgi:hypothetical protein